MDISNLRSTVDPVGSTTPAAALPGGVGTSSPGASGSAVGDSQAQAAQSTQQVASGSAASAVSAEALQKAVQKINQQLEQNNGVTLSAGLDTTGQHPGQVLVELSDKVTRQTFFKYYVPADQVVKAAHNPGASASTGTLINATA